MQLFVPIEVVVAGMTYGIYNDIQEAVEVSKTIPGSRIRTALGRVATTA
tara:strand:+ start:1150 stop:1296 length:147 start_codon:yes stop_codon:yes gene_type:complete